MCRVAVAVCSGLSRIARLSDLLNEQTHHAPQIDIGGLKYVRRTQWRGQDPIDLCILHPMADNPVDVVHGVWMHGELYTSSVTQGAA